MHSLMQIITSSLRYKITLNCTVKCFGLGVTTQFLLMNPINTTWNNTTKSQNGVIQTVLIDQFSLIRIIVVMIAIWSSDSTEFGSFQSTLAESSVIQSRVLWGDTKTCAMRRTLSFHFLNSTAKPRETKQNSENSDARQPLRYWDTHRKNKLFFFYIGETDS